MMNTIGYPAEVTTVDTSAAYKLGELRQEYDATYGWRTWRYVFNDEAATAFAAGNLIARDTTTVAVGDGIVAPVSTAVARLLGVAQHAIAAGSYGWILKTGIGEVLADTGGITADNALISGDNDVGCADNAVAVTDHAFAYAHKSALAGALATSYIFCP